jgi:hypothetical protein
MRGRITGETVGVWGLLRVIHEGDDAVTIG